MARVVIDPVTRIEGHLRVEIEVEDGVVKDAWASGGLYRGMETVLLDRAPADAFYIAQRICGVCPISHGHASTMAAESALGITIPNNARIIRNLIEGAESLHSHILWFYTLTALDYVDVTSALKANIADTYALAQAAGTRPADFGAIQKRLKTFVEGGQLSIFTQGYWGHPDVQAAAGAQPHRGRALPRGARDAGRRRRDHRDHGRQVPALHDVDPRRHRVGARPRRSSTTSLFRIAKVKAFIDDGHDPGHAGHRAVLRRRARPTARASATSCPGASSRTTSHGPEEAVPAARRHLTAPRA